MADIRVSALTTSDQEHSFYPEGTKRAEYLTYYTHTTKFGCVQIDSTLYRTTAISWVKGWCSKTPPGFIFAAKAPQVITHEKKSLWIATRDFSAHGIAWALIDQSWMPAQDRWFARFDPIT